LTNKYCFVKVILMEVICSMKYTVLEVHSDGSTHYYMQRQYDDLISQAFLTEEELFKSWSLGQINWRSLDEIIGKVGQKTVEAMLVR